MPARVEPGGLLSLEVEVASALTPPPGIQEERAHRAFAVSLCAEGTAFHAPARCCFPLAVRNVRPLDGRSLRYRVEAPVPLWVAPSRYDLNVRFPGGEAQLADAVRVGRWERDFVAPAFPGTAAPTELRRGSEAARVRLHVGPLGLDLSSLLPRTARLDPLPRVETFPLPDAQGLRTGFVALVDLGPGQTLRLRPARPRAMLAPHIAAAPVSAAGELALSTPASPGSRLFWWLGPDQGAQGATVEARFSMRGAARVQLVAIDAEGRVARSERLISLRATPTAGCAVGPGAGGAASDLLLAAGLLAVLFSRKLGPRARRW